MLSRAVAMNYLWHIVRAVETPVIIFFIVKLVVMDKGMERVT